MKKQYIAAALLSASLIGHLGVAQATLVTDLVFKLSDSATTRLNAYTGWLDTGGFNEGNAAAATVQDNGLDYKNSLVDLWPANMTNVRVSLYEGGTEVAYIDFDPTGTTKMDFFSQAHATGSTWTDITGPGNYFSIEGHAAIDRYWFVNNNYGGCPNDVGQMVIIDGDGSQPCNWENTRLGGNNRAFLYSQASTEVNWNTPDVGTADVFAVFITRDVNPTPIPGTLALLALGLAGIGYRRARR